MFELAGIPLISVSGMDASFILLSKKSPAGLRINAKTAFIGVAGSVDFSISLPFRKVNPLPGNFAVVGIQLM